MDNFFNKIYVYDYLYHFSLVDHNNNNICTIKIWKDNKKIFESTVNSKTITRKNIREKIKVIDNLI